MLFQSCELRFFTVVQSNKPCTLLPASSVPSPPEDVPRSISFTSPKQSTNSQKRVAAATRNVQYMSGMSAMRSGPMLISFSVACIPSRKTRTFFFRNMLCLQFAPGSGTRIQIKLKIITQYILGSHTVLSWQSEVMVTVCHRSERRYLRKSCTKTHSRPAQLLHLCGF